MLTPLVPELRIAPKPAPWVPSIVIAFVIVTAPNPPGSRASISPPGAVFDMAPANVLHGAVRLQGLASSPTPDTQVREAWPCIIAVPNTRTPNTVNNLILLMDIPFCSRCDFYLVSNLGFADMFFPSRQGA